MQQRKRLERRNRRWLLMAAEPLKSLLSEANWFWARISNWGLAASAYGQGAMLAGAAAVDVSDAVENQGAGDRVVIDSGAGEPEMPARLRVQTPDLRRHRHHQFGAAVPALGHHGRAECQR